MPDDTGQIGFFDWFDAVGESSLDRTEKALCMAYLKFTDHLTGLCWPSNETLAARASLSREGVQDVRTRLERLGVVVVIKKSRGGFGPDGIPITDEVRLDLAVLRSLKREPTPRLKREAAPRLNRGVDPPQARSTPGSTVELTRLKREAAPPKPSIQPSIEQSIEPSTAKAAGSAAAPGWMDGRPAGAPASDGRPRGLRHTLASAGVKGRMLGVLAGHAGLTVEMVQNELASIAADPKVRSGPAVLTTRLMDRLGIVTKGQPLTLELQRDTARLEEIRRDRGVTS